MQNEQPFLTGIETDKITTDRQGKIILASVNANFLMTGEIRDARKMFGKPYC